MKYYGNTVGAIVDEIKEKYDWLDEVAFRNENVEGFLPIVETKPFSITYNVFYSQENISDMFPDIMEASRRKLREIIQDNLETGVLGFPTKESLECIKGIDLLIRDSPQTKEIVFTFIIKIRRDDDD